MHLDAGNVEILNLGNCENLESYHHERCSSSWPPTFSKNDVQYVARNVKGILLYNFLAFRLSGKLVGLIKLDAGGKPSTWLPPGRLVELLTLQV